MKQSENCKYTPLESYLRTHAANQSELTLSFEQIEAAMHARLPKSAYERPTWWDNTIHSTLSHKHAWLHAGWQVEEVDLVGKWVHFIPCEG
jgi:hypothetical protein